MVSRLSDFISDENFVYVIFEEVQNGKDTGGHPEYHFLECCRSAKKILPLPWERLKGKTIPKKNTTKTKPEFNCFSAIQKSLNQPGLAFTFDCEKTLNSYKVTAFRNKNNYFMVQFIDCTAEIRQYQDVLHDYEQHKILSDLTIEGIVIHSHGFIDFANLSLLKTLGYNKNEVIGKNMFAFIHREDRDKASYYMTNKSTEPYELRIFHKDGSLRYMEVEAKNFMWENQERRVVAVRDLTTQKRDAIKHRERDILFSRITDNMTDVIWTSDLEMNTTYVSPSIQRILLESPEEHSQKSIEQKYTPESLENLYAILQDEMEKEKDPNANKNRSRYIESEHYRSDGTTIMVSENISFLRDEEGNAIGFVGVLRDISDKKAAEKSLLESEKKFRQIIETSHDIIFNMNSEGIFTYVSPSWTKTLGHAIHEIEGHSFVPFVHPDDVSLCMGFLKEAFETGKMLRGIEYRVQKKNGDWRWHTTSAAPIIDVEDNLTGYIGNASDITERKEYEAKLRESDHLLKNLSKQIPGMIYQYRLYPNGRACFQFSSDNIREIYELRPEEVKEDSTKVLQRLHPDDHRRVVDKIVESANNMTLWEDEYRVILPTKGERVLKGIAQPQLMDDGSVLWHGYIYDNTEQNKKDEALKESDNRFNALINAMEEIVFVKNADLKYIYSNPALERFFNLPKEHILGKSDYDLMPAEAAETCSQNDIETIKSKSSITSVELVGNKYLETHKFPVQLSDGNTGIGCYIADITDRKKAEKELAEKTELLENITSNMFDLVSLTDFHGNMVYFNKSHEIFGYSPNELKELNVFRLVHPEDHETVGLPFYKAILKGSESSAVYRYRCADGSYLWIETIGKALKDDNGRIKNLLFSSRDISARKKLEDVLKEREVHLQVMIENPFESIWSVNTKGELTYINENHLKSFEAVFGVKLQKGQKVLDHLPESIIPLWEERYRRLFKGEKFLMEDLFIHDGNTVFIEVAANPIIIDEKITGACFYGRDISERKHSELKIKRLAKLQTLLMNLATEFINLKPEQIEQAINLALEKLGQFVSADRSYIFKYDWEGKSSCNIYEWCAPGVTSFINELQDITFDKMYILPEVHSRHEPVIISDVSQLPESEPFRKHLEHQNVCSIINIPIVDNGLCTGFIGFDSRHKVQKCLEEEMNLLRIFTEIYVNLVNRQQLHESLIEEKDRSDAANKAKSEFLANMSHEIRTPLNGVIGFTDLLIKSGLEERQKQYAENANTAGKALLGIINDILDFSKIEAGKLELEKQRFQLNKLLDETSDIIKYQAGIRDIELILNFPPDLPEYIVCDPVRLKQILINLLNNAIKFTEKGEVEFTVTISTLCESRCDLQFSIRDTGIGISEEKQKKLFKAFSQADSSTSRKFGGTGLGLIISNLLAEKMEGNITIESEEGRGSVFTLHIQTEYIREIKELQPPPLSFNKILIIDDNERAGEIASQIFNTFGAKCVWVDNGISALKIAKKESFDLIVVDQDMPYIDGLDTLQKLRTESTSNDQLIPAWLLINPSKGLVDEEICNQLGIEHQCVKPISINKLTRMVNMPVSIELTDDSIELFTVDQPLNKNTDYSLLIAEDVPMNMILVKTLVEEFLPNAAIYEASNGLEAITVVQNHQVDLILMDIQMPEMDGYAATRKIRELELQQGSRIPIVALTAGALKEERDKALECGMDEFLTKPLEADKLQEVFIKYLVVDNHQKKISTKNGIQKGTLHFDKAAFLKKFNNNQVLLTNLAKLCLQDIPPKLNALERAIDEGDCQKIKLTAHTVKGQALNMMFHPMAELCARIEENAKNDCEFAIQSVMEEVKNEWALILVELKQIA
ncbi:MAG: PAS domain S-box protein [Cyclobacteriaceae bacterium]|nr:PAS domain S-box protein [Cyclobacteriaceae bacterium]